MTFLHFNQLLKITSDISKGCIFASDTVYLVHQGACGKLFQRDFPTQGGSVQDLITQEQYLLCLLFVR